MEKINGATKEYIAQGAAKKIQIEAIAKDFEHAISRSACRSKRRRRPRLSLSRN